MYDSNTLPNTGQETNSSTTTTKKFLISVFIVFNRLTVVSVSFRCLRKGIAPKIYRLCVCVIINKRLLEPAMRWDLPEVRLSPHLQPDNTSPVELHHDGPVAIEVTWHPEAEGPGYTVLPVNADVLCELLTFNLLWTLLQLAQFPERHLGGENKTRQDMITYNSLIQTQKGSNERLFI